MDPITMAIMAAISLGTQGYSMYKQGREQDKAAKNAGLMQWSSGGQASGGQAPAQAAAGGGGMDSIIANFIGKMKEQKTQASGLDSPFSSSGRVNVGSLPSPWSQKAPAALPFPSATQNPMDAPWLR